MSEIDKKLFLNKNKKKLDAGGGYRVLSDKMRKKISKEISNLIEDGQIPENTGIFLTRDEEDLPVYGPIGLAEKVISRRSLSGRISGARIVLTKDNYGHRGTGLGGMGGTMCEAIDIVAGSLTCEKKLHNGQTESRANFATDGARIYLTERGDIQNYFALGPGGSETSISSMLKSGIGIKADHTLIIGRERARILVGTSAVEGGERTANMNENPTGRIDIGQASAGEGAFQPAVMGNALIEYLQKINDRITSVAEYAQGIEDRLLAMRVDFASHFHSGAGLGYIQTFPDPILATKAGAAVRPYLLKTTEKVIDQMNFYLDDAKAFGIADGAVGSSAESGILSNTVYIGK